MNTTNIDFLNVFREFTLTFSSSRSQMRTLASTSFDVIEATSFCSDTLSDSKLFTYNKKELIYSLKAFIN